ncbi:glycosyltransferase family 2 protein [Patescibacteria group bacterium]|nr:glycosyltransferase family 2 protein [Patescibacteria group bacterium]MBU1728265.1 glycosyltransferase family 2 protein [Patescibacteria group bacterium]
MASISNIIFFILTFLCVYVQVFFLLTFFEKKKKILIRKESFELDEYLGVTVIVPCYNEEKTIKGTIDSLLALDYPEEKLKLIVIDDGSKDNTWTVIKEFEKHPNIKVFRKNNGGKYTALNMGLLHTDTPFVGCLDADSFVDSQALKRIMTYFEDKDTMAVAPSIIVDNPRNILQGAQKAEYEMAVYNKKMLAFLGGIHVTPGPFSIFRKKVFEDLGPYRHAHNTEDQEIALRMQKNHYKIEHCPDAYVYTVAPNSVKKLYRQRVRWIYGFIRNAIDYRRLLFNKKYGTIAFFTLPSGLISVASAIFLFWMFLYNFISFLIHKISQIKIVGLSFTNNFSFDWFFFDTKTIFFVSIILYTSVIASLLIGRSMIEGKIRFSFDILYFVIIYSALAPFWILKAIYNAIRSKQSSWTLERDVDLIGLASCKVELAKKGNATTI